MFDRDAAVASFQRALTKLDRGDPRAIATVLEIPAVSTTKQTSQRKSDYQKTLKSSSGTDWSGVLNFWLGACEAAEKGNAVDCYEKQAALHNSFNQIFSSSKGNLLVPAMHSVCKSTHQCASFADLEAGNRDHAKLNQAANILRDSFSKSVNDRKEYKSDAPYGEEGSKKSGVLGIVNELFAIYFTLNTLRLCMNIIRPVEQRSLHDAGPISHKVTYRYYVGRLNLYEDNYDGAEANLEYAFTNCHKDAIRNKRCILRYLIPVKLYRAKLPSPELLEKYQLHEFTMLTESLRTGDLKKLNAALSDHQDRFIRQGTLLLLERCKAICYRNLFKRIHLIADKHIILLKQVVIVFKWLEMDIDLDEVECILANLIHRGIVRGYLHHMKRALVLSKRDPFPVAALPGK